MISTVGVVYSTTGPIGRSAIAAVIAVALAAAPAGSAVAGPSLSHSADTANLVVDSDFSNGFGGWQGHLFNAKIATVNGGAAASISNSGYVGQDVRVIKGGRYDFSVRAGGSGSVLVLALDSRTGVGYVGQTVTSPAAVTVAGTFSAIGDTVYVACQAAGGAGGWCTNFSVTPSSTPGCAGSGVPSGSACPQSARLRPIPVR